MATAVNKGFVTSTKEQWFQTNQSLVFAHKYPRKYESEPEYAYT